VCGVWVGMGFEGVWVRWFGGLGCTYVGDWSCVWSVFVERVGGC